MWWVLQENILNEPAYAKILAALQAAKLPTCVIKVIPFSHDIEPVLMNRVKDTSDKVIIFGTTAVIDVAKKQRWTPGVYYNDNFSFPAWSSNYGINCLNFYAGISEFGTITNPPTKEFFIRPLGDDKEFNGRVISHDEFVAWRDQVSAGGDPANPLLTNKTWVAYAPVQEIYQEFRSFIVDGKVITTTQYRQCGHKMAEEYLFGPALNHIEHMVNLWQPAKAFVLDTCLTPNGYQIMEIGCINCSGWYAADMPAVINAIEAMER